MKKFDLMAFLFYFISFKRIMINRCRTFIKRPLSSPLKWKAYVAPFTWGIWSSIGVVIVVTSVTIFFVKSIVPLISENIKDVKNSSSSFPDIFLEVFGAFCSQGIFIYSNSLIFKEINCREMKH